VASAFVRKDWVYSTLLRSGLHGFREQHIMLAHKDVFSNPLVHTFWNNKYPSVITMSSALAE